MSDEVLEIFRKCGAVKQGHFLLASGLHSPVYWEKFRILQYPDYTVKLCQLIALHFEGEKIDVVAGPTTGGIILAFETARLLGVQSIFAEKKGDTRTFRRDFAITPGSRVLIVDDILTTGGSVRETVSAVNELGSLVIGGIGVLVDRSQGEIDFGGIPFFSCLRAPTTTYTSEECPLCAVNVPLTKPGAPGKQGS